MSEGKYQPVLFGPQRSPQWCSAQVAEMWGIFPQWEIAKRIGYSRTKVVKFARHLGLVKPPRAPFTAPTFEEWRSAAMEEAQKAGLHRMAVIRGELDRRAVIARWAAWERLRKSGRFSLAGIGRASGFDHTSVLHGLRRLESARAQLMGVR